MYCLCLNPADGNDPSARPQTEFLCKPIQEVMEQESLTRNHLREASGKHLGGIWTASRRHLEGIWEASGRHLEASGRHLQASGGIWKHLEASGSIWKHLEASGSIWKHLGDTWETSGKHLGGIWEASGRLLGGFWEASGRQLGLQATMGLQEALNHKNQSPSQLKYNISIKT